MPSSTASSVSLRPSTWALAYMPAPDQRSYQELRAAWTHSSDQPFIGQPLPCRAVNKAVEPLQGMPLHIALIEPKSELINIPAKVLRADMVKGAVDAALQDGPNSLNAIGRNPVADI